MNIKEAYAKATPGPLIAETSILGVCISKPVEGEGYADSIAVMRVDDERARHTAALFAHAYNVLPELLAKLQPVMNLIADDKSRYEAWRTEVEALQDAINGASEVKV